MSSVARKVKMSPLIFQRLDKISTPVIIYIKLISLVNNKADVKLSFLTEEDVE